VVSGRRMAPHWQDQAARQVEQLNGQSKKTLRHHGGHCLRAEGGIYGMDSLLNYLKKSIRLSATSD